MFNRPHLTAYMCCCNVGHGILSLLILLVNVLLQFPPSVALLTLILMGILFTNHHLAKIRQLTARPIQRPSFIYGSPYPMGDRDYIYLLEYEKPRVLDDL